MATAKNPLVQLALDDIFGNNAKQELSVHCKYRYIAEENMSMHERKLRFPGLTTSDLCFFHCPKYELAHLIRIQHFHWLSKWPF